VSYGNLMISFIIKIKQSNEVVSIIMETNDAFLDRWICLALHATTCQFA
jgi:hypothetical protein